MTDHNRGAYTPQSDAPLAFDARRTGGPGQRPFPTTLLVSAVILLALIAAAFFLYRDGTRSPDDPPQPVGEPVVQMKAPPPAEANSASEAEGLKVYMTDDPTAQPKLAPPPEQPLPRPVAPVETVPLKAPAPVASASATPATPSAPPAAPLSTPPAKLAAAPTPKAATPAAGGGTRVQVGSFSSTAMAEDAWSRLARTQPGLMAGKGRQIETAEVAGSTYYRTLVGGFASRAEAQAFCDQLRGRGEDCAVR